MVGREAERVKIAIFGSRWLWNGLQEEEITASVALLQGLAARDVTGVMSRMRTAGKVSVVDTVRALVKLELVVIDRGHLKLSRKGREFLGLKSYRFFTSQ